MDFAKELSLNTQDIIDQIFKDPGTKYELTEFEVLGKPLHESFPFIQKLLPLVGMLAKPSTISRASFRFHLAMKRYRYLLRAVNLLLKRLCGNFGSINWFTNTATKIDEIDLEASIQFGTEVGTKAADVIVYTDNTKETPKIIVECKKPKRKDGIEQLKSYMNAKGAPVAIWSNGSDSIILYRPYPQDYDDTLSDIPKRGQKPTDVLEAKKTIDQLKEDFNFKKIIQDLEELVLADSGKDEFNEIFKLIFAKIWDEKEAVENRKGRTVEFSKAIDPDITYDRINGLFKKACEEWSGIFRVNEDIELAKRHLQVCIGPIEGLRLMGSNLRIMDDAFEYLLPTEAKKKKGQFFTPRHVVEMCVRMLNPTRKEYVMDPSCGSGGFLLHAMDWCYPADNNEKRELRKHKYAAKYLWGIDFEARAAKTSRALMLIAGDGHTNIFGPDVSSLDPKTWYESASGQALMQGLRQAKLTAITIPDNEILKDDDKAWEYFDELKFDVILANPPFAGEMKDRKMLAHYDLARPALKRAGDDKAPKAERDVLFIERILKMLRPGGRAAIVLPQGKFNNSSLAFIREWILKKARLLAVVGLHPNTFKPHTGTKTSVLFIQKYTKQKLDKIARVHDEVAKDCPAYEAEIQSLLDRHGEVPEEDISEAIADLISETFSEPEAEDLAEDEDKVSDDETAELPSDEERIAQAEEKIEDLKTELSQVRQKLTDLDSEVEALQQQQQAEIENMSKIFDGNKRELSAHLKPIKAAHKEAVKELKAVQKEKTKRYKDEIKRLEKEIPKAEYDLKLLTNRGKLELILADDDLIATLKERWIAAEVAKRLDYPIFMAVSERGGKNNSGDYDYVLDEDSHFVEDASGQPKIDQDLVNYDLTADDLADAGSIPDNQLCVAEAFIRFAQQHDLDFWRFEWW